MNQENLIPFSDRTDEDKKRIASMGGKARAEKIHRRKTLREELLSILESGDIQKNITLALLSKAADGDTKAYEVLRDTLGEKLPTKIEADVDTSVKINIGIDDDE